MRSLSLFVSTLALLALRALAAPPLPASAYDPMNDPNRPVAKSPSLSPAETAKALQVPEGFSVELVASEPQIKQPIAHTIDDRGRLWILENTNYPTCPGTPKDRILILEDTDGDGKYDKQSVFYDKLTFASGLAVGFGGVYVGAPPNLLFIPDKDGDGVPDGEPEVLLDGWGDEDRHETLNDFIWGPDGWLYGTQGVFTFSKVGAPGTPPEQRVPINAGVFRFHPQTKKFERYCEGGSNQWGIDWNDHGQAFFAACVIPHIWQCIQGARYKRQAGQPSNPYTYDEIQTIGGFEYEKRAYCGAMVYLGGLFPPELRDTFFFHDIHINKLRNEKMEREGSGYKALRNLDFVVSRDPWFRGLSPQYGPDGGVFINDWYDKVPCYQQRDQVDPTNGRIYKIGYTGLKPTPVDLTKASSAELVQMQLHPNDWFVRHARRLLQERGPDAEVQKALEKIVRGNPDDTRQLRALWALHGIGGLSEALALEQLGNASEYVRGWIIQLLCEKEQPSPAVLARFAELAKSDASPLVRLYLAAAAQRWEPKARWPVLTALAAHAEDATDHNLPQLLWYAMEPAVAEDFAQAATLLGASRLGKVQENIARRVTTAGLASGDATPLSLLLNTIARQGANVSTDELSRNVLRGINLAMKGQRNLPAPAEWAALYANFKASANDEIRREAKALAVTFGDADALSELRRTLADRKAPLEQRKLAFDSLSAIKDAPSIPFFVALLGEPGPLRGGAVKALSTFDDATIPTALLAAYPKLASEEKRDAMAALTGRPVWARALLAAIDQKAMGKADLSAPILRQLQDLKDPEVEAWVKKNYGAVRALGADKQREISRLKTVLNPGFLAKGDASHGRALFQQTCAICHTVFGAGAKIGPELPGAFTDIDYLLQNILDPNAIIGKDYQQNLVQTKDGQTLAGIVAGEDANTLTLKSLAGPVVIQRGDIVSLTVLDISLMPEGLLAGRSETEIRDLFAYLGRHGQVPLLADSTNANDFFNGTDLAHWVSSTERTWRVENGELVGYGEPEAAHVESDIVARKAKINFEVEVRGAKADGLVSFAGRTGQGGPILHLKAEGATVQNGTVTEPPAAGAKPGIYRIEVAADEKQCTVALNGQSVYSGPAFNAGAEDAAIGTGIVLHFALQGEKSELRIRNLKLTATEP